SLYSINLIAENKYRDREMNKDDTFLGVRLSVNLFNLDNKLAKLSDLETYRSLSFDYDKQYKLLKNQLKLCDLITKTNKRELQNLQQQLSTTEDLVYKQEKEYDINQTSLYEMLNTRFDLFKIEKAITDIKVSEAKNKIKQLQLYGGVLLFFIDGE
ncbi:hypothetical protein EK906_24540, partial [Salmonella enterica subsp. enterica serovar Kentucky]|nr:hypothetical protein [Salmonella enterica subsp. enterica serovar Kentucky]